MLNAKAEKNLVPVYSYHALEVHTFRKYIEKQELALAICGTYDDNYWFLHGWRVGLAKVEIKMTAADREKQSVVYLDPDDFILVKTASDWCQAAIKK